MDPEHRIDSKPDSSTEEDSSTPTPGTNTDSTDTLHVHTSIKSVRYQSCRIDSVKRICF